jgi:hypothetical protein
MGARTDQSEDWGEGRGAAEGGGAREPMNRDGGEGARTDESGTGKGRETINRKMEESAFELFSVEATFREKGCAKPAQNPYKRCAKGVQNLRKKRQMRALFQCSGG